VKGGQKWIFFGKQGQKKNRFVVFASSVVGLLCYALSSFFRNFFVSALVFAKNSKTVLLFKKIAEIPYFF